MKRFSKLLQWGALVLTMSAPALAADGNEGIGPNIPEAVKGEQCVEPTDVMRRKHPDYLNAHRDDTMHEGIRTTKYSLKECINCHVPAEDTQQQASHDNAPQFCASCHNFAGVNVDCFQCHATKPEQSAMFHPLVTPGMESAKAAHGNGNGSGDLLNQLAGTEQNVGTAHE